MAFVRTRGHIPKRGQFEDPVSSVLDEGRTDGGVPWAQPDEVAGVRVRSGFASTDTCGDAVLSSSRIEALLREPLVRWPEGSPVTVREIAESTDEVGAAILAVGVDAASLDRSELTGRVIQALSEAVTGTYLAWLPEAEHLAGPGGAGARDLRAHSRWHGPVRPVPPGGCGGVAVRAAYRSGGVRAGDGCARRRGARPRRSRTIPGGAAAVQNRGVVRWRIEFRSAP